MILRNRKRLTIIVHKYHEHSQTSFDNRRRQAPRRQLRGSNAGRPGLRRRPALPPLGRRGAANGPRTSEQGVRSEPFQADVSEQAEVERLFDAVLGSFGRLDVLVTAAAVWERKRLEEVTAEDVLRQFSVNTLGTFLFCHGRG